MRRERVLARGRKQAAAPTGCHMDPSEGAEDQGGPQGQGRRDRVAWTLGQDQFVLQEKPRIRRAGVGDAGRAARLLLKVPTGNLPQGSPWKARRGKLPSEGKSGGTPSHPTLRALL